MAEEEEEKGADRLLFSFLTLISKLGKHCSMLELAKPHEMLCKIWGKKNHTHTHTPANDNVNTLRLLALMRQ